MLCGALFGFARACGGVLQQELQRGAWSCTPRVRRRSHRSQSGRREGLLAAEREQRRTNIRNKLLSRVRSWCFLVPYWTLAAQNRAADRKQRSSRRAAAETLSNSTHQSRTRGFSCAGLPPLVRALSVRAAAMRSNRDALLVTAGAAGVRTRSPAATIRNSEAQRKIIQSAVRPARVSVTYPPENITPPNSR